MDIFEAAYRVAHDFPERGAVGLAARIGKNPGTFLNEVSGAVETAKLGWATAVAMSVAAGDARMLHAFADALGFVAVRRPEPDALASDQAILDLFLFRDVKAGAFGATVQAALADGRITPQEMAEIRRSAYEAIQSVLNIRERLSGLIDGA